jgi:hypothetical protein
LVVLRLRTAFLRFRGPYGSPKAILQTVYTRVGCYFQDVEEKNLSIERKDLLAINQIGWNVVAPQFYGGTALPNYGPLSITEQELQLLVLERLIESELNIDLAREKDYLPEK